MENEKKKYIPGAKAGTYKPRGVRGNGATQGRFNFRVDPDLQEWLDSQVNRNRYLNNLVREDKIKNQGL